jgi:hypothetical protein
MQEAKKGNTNALFVGWQFAAFKLYFYEITPHCGN